MLISTNLLAFQEQMSGKKDTEELISKLKISKVSGRYCDKWAEFYEENTQFILFYAEIAQIRNEELYK